MFRLFTPVLILEVFCLYHAFKNNADQKWYWLILIFPLVGCILYLYDHYYSRKNLENVTENIKGVVNTNYKVEQLEKDVNFTGTIANKTKLAEEYVSLRRFKEAIDLYQSCLEGFNKDDPDIRMKLVMAYYLDKNFKEATELGKSLEGERLFATAPERIAYAWSLFHEDRVDEARTEFEAMDIPYKLFEHRLEFARFMLELNEKDEAKRKLQGLLQEFEHMDGYERKLKRGIHQRIRSLYTSLSTNA